MKEKTVIGRIERINFPDLDLNGIEAKVDTGAYNSSIHCHDIYENQAGNSLYFKLLDPSHPDYNNRELVFTKYSKTTVKSSTGVAESRYKIKIRVEIGSKTYLTTFTLTDRGSMKFPVLLGRVVLKNRFVVDVQKKNILK